jgi:predicted porin
MKKLVLVLVLVLAFSVTALANPFVDVPLNHWAYDSVQGLAAKGVIVGYPDGTFGGGKTMTRYEFAEAVGKALAYVEGMDFASAEDVAILEKLAIEFADELASLGVTVADLEASLGAHSEAIAALETTVAKLDTFFDPVVITGDINVEYSKVILPAVATATLKDSTEIGLEAEVNDTTTVGIEMEFENVLNENVNLDVDSWKFWLEHDGPDLRLSINEIEPDDIGLGLIYAFDTYQEEFWGVWAQWMWDADDSDLGTWTVFMDVEDFYILNIGFEAGDDDIPIGVTASYDPLALGYAASVDLSFDIGDEDDTNVAVEAGMFYGATMALAGVVSLSGEYDDFNLDADVYYVQDGFVPTNTDWDEDVAGVDLTVGFPLTDEEDDTQIDVEVGWNYEMDATTFAIPVTHEISAELAFVIDADTEEEAMIGATYDVLTGGIDLEAEYLNLPLGDEEDTEFMLSAHAEYAVLTGDYMGVATLVYAFEDDMTLLLEGRVDTFSAFAPYSAEVKLEYAVAENTDIYVGFEYNDWDDDINDWDEYAIVGTDSTLYAGIDVDF